MGITCLANGLERWNGQWMYSWWHHCVIDSFVPSFQISEENCRAKVKIPCNANMKAGWEKPCQKSNQKAFWKGKGFLCMSGA